MPQAHTCFFSIELPAYSSVDAMRGKLLYAIHNCRAIDTDGSRGGAGDGGGAMVGLDSGEGVMTGGEIRLNPL